MADLPEIDSLWNYLDPRGSETVFQQLRAAVGDDAPADYRAQLLSQIARAQTLQKQFAIAHATLDEATGLLGSSTPIARIRVPLERGRIWNDTDEFDKASRCFQEAFQHAREARHDPLAADALHMLGVLPPAAEAVEWNRTGITFAEASSDPKVRRWLGTFWLNMGLKHQDLAQFAEADQAFRAAIREYETLGNTARIRLCRLCLGKNLRLQEHYQPALEIDLPLLAEIETAGGAGDPLGYTCEEIAECLLALGRPDEARPFFERAYELLSADPWFPPTLRARLERLRLIVQGDRGIR